MITSYDLQTDDLQSFKDIERETYNIGSDFDDFLSELANCLTDKNNMEKVKILEDLKRDLFSVSVDSEPETMESFHIHRLAIVRKIQELQDGEDGDGKIIFGGSEWLKLRLKTAVNERIVQLMQTFSEDDLQLSQDYRELAKGLLFG